MSHKLSHGAPPAFIEADILPPGEAIAADRLRQRAGYGPHGALVVFEGVVRPTEQGRILSGLQYEAHPVMAQAECATLLRQAAEQFGLIAAVCHHRTGFVAAGDTAVVVVTAAPHRPEAFAACQSIIEELKKVVPIWKTPVFEENADAPPDGAATGDVSRGIH